MMTWHASAGAASPRRRRSIRLIAGAAAVAALVFSTGHATAQDVQLPSDLPQATALALQAELAAARDQGLPTQPLVLKALEGLSKGATHPQIIHAVRGLRQRLTLASTTLGSGSQDVIEAAGAALYAGVSVTALADLGRSTRPDALGMALVVLGDLVRQGVPVRSAERAILSLGSAGADVRAFSDFRRSVDEDIRTGLAPGRAAELRLRGMLTRVRGTGGIR
jgi:hypothetical protein